jgi:hypothetical protein
LTSCGTGEINGDWREAMRESEWVAREDGEWVCVVCVLCGEEKRKVLLRGG